MANKAKHFWIEPDELSRKGLDFCSLAAQGLWLKVMRLMHDSERYGYLCRDGKAVTDEQLARRCGVDVQALLTLMAELTDFDLLKRTADGILFAPELVAQAEWRSKEAKRQKDFQDKKRAEQASKYHVPTNGRSNGSTNGYITDDLTGESRPNSKLLKPPSFSNEKKGGGGSRANGDRPPPADSPPAYESLKDYLLRKQLEFPHNDVTAVHADFVKKCGSDKYPNLKNTRRHFDKWLAEQDVEFETDAAPEKSAREIAIENCSKCNENGRIKVDGKFRECSHGGESNGS